MGIGLALAGGGSKGAAHIGVIKAFEEENIDIDYISGTSSGSIIAALFAMGYNSKEIYYLFNKYSSNVIPFSYIYFAFSIPTYLICHGSSLYPVIFVLSLVYLIIKPYK